MGDVGPLTVERVALEATSDLRHRVLRPEHPPESVFWSSFEVAGAATFAVLDPSGSPLTTVTVMPEPCPWRHDEDAPWRLRGMATEAAWRGHGLGRVALDTALAHVVGERASVLWCNARVAAVGFYERAGFTVDGDEFDVPGIGPHRPMSRPIDRDPPLAHGGRPPFGA